MTLSKFDRCTKICNFLDSDKYVSMGLSSKADILRVLSCKLKERNYWLLHRKKEILKVLFVYKHKSTIEHAKNSLLFKKNLNFTGK